MVPMTAGFQHAFFRKLRGEYRYRGWGEALIVCVSVYRLETDLEPPKWNPNGANINMHACVSWCSYSVSLPRQLNCANKKGVTIIPPSLIIISSFDHSNSRGARSYGIIWRRKTMRGHPAQKEYYYEPLESFRSLRFFMNEKFVHGKQSHFARHSCTQRAKKYWLW